jgi:hypothetical protein
MTGRQQQTEAARVAAATIRGDALAAAAVAMRTGRDRITPRESTWQREAWGFYEDLGEFGYGVDWRANKISRVRLRAARLDPDQDEPVIDEEPSAASALVERLAGGDPAAQGDLLSTLAVYLDVPGEGWLVGERDADGTERWYGRSNEEIRRRDQGIEVIDDETSAVRGSAVWRPLAADSLITRVWRPHRRFRHQATSAARGARTIMRELELVNRHIQAQYLSRLASAGVVIFPEEVTFPVREEFADAPDPFVAEWIETAKEAIATPGTAAAVVPIPMRMPGEFIDKITHLDFTLKIDEKILEKREAVIRRLATRLDMPAEVLLGTGDINHWGQWFIDEDSIKTHIAPTVEMIVSCLTVGYLRPLLAAEGGQDPDAWVVWYDLSELTQRPDKSANAVAAYDRFELSGAALRRETGFDEADAPERDELRAMGLKAMLKTPQVGLGALDELTGTGTPVPGVGTGGGPGSPPVPEPDMGPPEPVETEPGPPEAARAAMVRTLTAAQVEEHRVALGLGGWEVWHPTAVCEAAEQASCPVTWAMYEHPGIAPGTSGLYRVRVGDDGDIHLGEPAHAMVADVDWVTTPVKAGR